jgi:hypothetical protein
MPLDPIREASSPWRRIFALGCIGAFLLTIALADAPRLHERIHRVQGAEHECAVTLLTAGNCEHTPCDAIALAPPPPRPASAPFHRHFQLVSARLEFSLLEHAPPAIS